MNRKFIIFNVSEIDKIDFSVVLETSPNTLRKSINGQKTFIKWDGEITPECVNNLITKEGPYTYPEMLAILNTSEWSNMGPVV